MLNPEMVREATRLTRAGRLIEATALLQRLLGAEDGRARAAARFVRAEPAKLEPPTIDVKANVVGQAEYRTAKAPSIPGRKFRLPFGGLKDFPGEGCEVQASPLRRPTPTSCRTARSSSTDPSATMREAAPTSFSSQAARSRNGALLSSCSTDARSRRTISPPVPV